MTGYRAWFKTMGENKFYTNALIFSTKEEAEAHGNNLYSRWMRVEEWEVRETEQPPTHSFTKTDQGYSIEPLMENNQ